MVVCVKIHLCCFSLSIQDNSLVYLYEILKDDRLFDSTINSKYRRSKVRVKSVCDRIHNVDTLPLTGIASKFE